MAQNFTFRKAPSSGMTTTMKMAFMRLENTAAEATFNVTPALCGLTGIFAVIATDEGGQSAIQHNPTVDANGLITTMALSFTAGRELNVTVFGY